MPPSRKLRRVSSTLLVSSVLQAHFRSLINLPNLLLNPSRKSSALASGSGWIVASGKDEIEGEIRIYKADSSKFLARRVHATQKVSEKITKK